MKRKLKTLLPNPESLRNNRWVNWMGPVLHHPRLWHFSRKGISLGVALGIFFGLLIPVAQIPVAAVVAVVLRANLPMAVASTLVTNPVTFGPVYYGAYKLGKKVLGDQPVSEKEALRTLTQAHTQPQEMHGFYDRTVQALRHLSTVGKPLMVGLAIVATVSGLLVYFLVSAVWVLMIRWNRRKRLRTRKQRTAVEPME
ncbi:DUF2062 domain-containing protein [Hydrogenophaga sp.]|uniref:DUF2062 domain-containing protein n=1 Tax=Hydrogenophaga sp. TaxID=1904254 RepID=UPI00356B0D51